MKRYAYPIGRASVPHVVLSCPCGWQVATPMTLEGDRWSNHLGPLPLHDCGSDALWLVCRDISPTDQIDIAVDNPFTHPITAHLAWMGMVPVDDDGDDDGDADEHEPA